MKKTRQVRGVALAGKIKKLEFPSRANTASNGFAGCTQTDFNHYGCPPSDGAVTHTNSNTCFAALTTSGDTECRFTGSLRLTKLRERSSNCAGFVDFAGEFLVQIMALREFPWKPLDVVFASCGHFP